MTAASAVRPLVDISAWAVNGIQIAVALDLGDIDLHPPVSLVKQEAPVTVEPDNGIMSMSITLTTSGETVVVTWTLTPSGTWEAECEFEQVDEILPAYGMDASTEGMHAWMSAFIKGHATIETIREAIGVSDPMDIPTGE